MASASSSSVMCIFRAGDVMTLGTLLKLKGQIIMEVGQHALALATLREADAFLAEADRKGLLTKSGQSTWAQLVCSLGIYYLPTHQIDAAKQCFLRVINWPRLRNSDRLESHRGMARCHKERNEWDKVIECSNAALSLLPAIRSESPIPGMMQCHDVLFASEGKLLLLLADAYEGKGDMERAREYDVIAMKFWDEKNDFSELVA